MGIRFHVGDSLQIVRLRKTLEAMSHASGMRLEARGRLVSQASELAKTLLGASAGGGTLVLSPLRKDEGVGMEVSIEAAAAGAGPQGSITVWDR